MRRLSRTLVALVAGLLVLTGCGFSGGGGGFISGDSSITWLPVAQRQAVGSVVGDAFNKSGSVGRINLSSFNGKVVVVNVWGSWCAPCRAEAPRLEAALESLEKTYGTGVQFVGINTRDSSIANGIAFDRTYGVNYPSIFDVDGSTLLAFHGQIVPNATPTTIVLDKQGRVAASVSGPVTSSVTLADLVQDVILGRTHVS